MPKSKNTFEMYMDNNYRFGFLITRESWATGRQATVVSIDGVKEGEPIEGKPPYFNRHYPPGHPKEGKIWPRTILNINGRITLMILIPTQVKFLLSVLQIILV